jgi:hypothetical protein
MLLRTQVCFTVRVAILVVRACSQARHMYAHARTSMFENSSHGDSRICVSLLTCMLMRAQVCLSMRTAVLVVHASASACRHAHSKFSSVCVHLC